jgi:glycosyltransferase involved in cell wall biosynthesis
MLLPRLYYMSKPWLPPGLRFAVRRWLAARKRPRVNGEWPILPGSEQPPDGWPGWPDGKKFAVVLTHDVEGSAGLEKCRALANLEKELGFRSCFNFIPEGSYRVSTELRNELAADGFEIGVHDLHHNGKLFRDHDEFVRDAQRINGYLREWRAVGFRAGFMLRKLKWFHHLDIEYDASTFDTDPFEPQPDGICTIFPFWVSNQGGENGNPGYVELPYTVPQDSTLFLLLREKTPAIWIRKVDWIAQHSGMVLVNVHPDYIRFEHEPRSARTYSVAHYVALLKHIRDRYAGLYWQPLAWQMARLVQQIKPQAPRKRRRIGMITYSHFSTDARVKRCAQSLAERGDHVDVVALRRSPEEPARQQDGNINLIALQVRLGKRENSPLSFLWPVVRFLISSATWISRAHFRQRYDLLHIHNIPDLLVFAGIYPRLTGTKIILDIHDIVPEFYSSKFKVPAHSPIIRLLKVIERMAAGFANHVIISNHLWRETYAARTRTEDRCSVFINNVDTATFYSRARTRDDGKLLILFPGGLQWHQGLDIAIRAFQRVAAEFPNAEFHIYGDGNMRDSLVALASQLNLADRVRFFDPRPVQQIAEVMANSDLGVVPKRADSFGNEAYSTKIMEFMSLGVPVVVSSTKIDRFYFDNSVVRFFESGNLNAMAEAMIHVLSDSSLRQRLVANASKYVARNGWDSRKSDYLRLVDALIDNAPIPGECVRSPAPDAATPFPAACSEPAPDESIVHTRLHS